MDAAVIAPCYDVVVVGAGIAGLSAAVAAGEKGASVLLLEKAPYKERGGNGRRSGTFRVAYGTEDELFKLVSPREGRPIRVAPYGVEEFYSDVMRVTGGRADPDLAKTVVEKSRETLYWLTRFGAEFELSPADAFDVGDTVHYQPGNVIRVKGGGEGEALTSALFRHIEKQGIPIIYEAQVKNLLSDNRGRVTGVSLSWPGGKREIASSGVVLATGGFEANAEMRARYLGPEWERVKVRGTRHNTGDGIRLALAAGADMAGDWSGAHAGMIDANAPDVWSINRAIRRSYAHGIIVNREGKRFFDEGEDYEPLLYAKLGRAILQQPGQIAFQLFDQKARGMLSPYYKEATQASANSIEELALRLGIPREPLAATIGEFNRAIVDVPFNPAVKDGRGTRGIEPPKSNWAQAIDTPPYMAFPGVCGITFTFGGVRVDAGTRVLDKRGDPVPGLYAAGEVTGGLLYGHYPLGASLTGAAVFGRLSGLQAAAANEK